MARARTWSGEYTQASAPHWTPLIELVGERVTGDFMWMCEYELSDGSVLHAYMHIDTRRYIHLRPDGVAYAFICSSGRYRIVHAAEQLVLIFSGMEKLAVVTDEQVDASWETVGRVAAKSAGSASPSS